MRPYVGYSRNDTVLCTLLDRLSGRPDRWLEWRTLVDELAAGSRQKARGMPKEWYVVLSRLKAKKLLENKKRARRLMVRLTDAGEYRALIKSLKTREDHYPIGTGCIVVYDIPESERDARDLFRRFLKECGFQLLQQSIFVSRKDVVPLVVRFIKQNKLTPWVRVIEGKIRI